MYYDFFCLPKLRRILLRVALAFAGKQTQMKDRRFDTASAFRSYMSTYFLSVLFFPQRTILFQVHELVLKNSRTFLKPPNPVETQV